MTQVMYIGYYTGMNKEEFDVMQLGQFMYRPYNTDIEETWQTSKRLYFIRTKLTLFRDGYCKVISRPLDLRPSLCPGSVWYILSSENDLFCRVIMLLIWPIMVTITDINQTYEVDRPGFLHRKVKKSCWIRTC